MFSLNSETILSTLKKEKDFLKQNFGVLEIGIFGSYANGDFNSDSDIDIAVKFVKPSFDYFVNLQIYLEKNLNSKIDLYRLRDSKTNFQKLIEKNIIYV